MKSTKLPDYVEVASIAIDFCRLPRRDDHFYAVQLIFSSALEHFRGVVHLFFDYNPLPAKALSRVLLETLTTGLVLAKHPEKLDEFRDCGLYLHLRSLRQAEPSSDWGPKARGNKLLAKHGKDYEGLKKRYSKKHWHGMTRREALAEAGFTFDGLDMYDDFYRPASEFTHAEPSRYLMHNLDGELIIGRMERKEIAYLLGAYISSLNFFLIAIEEVNNTFGLGFSERIQHFKNDFFNFVPVYRAALALLLDPSYRKAKIAISRRKRTFVISKK